MRFTATITATIEAPNQQAAQIQAAKVQKLLGQNMTQFMLRSEGVDLKTVVVGQPVPTTT